MKVRVINSDGSQLGVLSLLEALSLSEQAGLDLVEISPNAQPPVCKIIDYGKYRYQLTKKRKRAEKNTASDKSKRS